MILEIIISMSIFVVLSGLFGLLLWGLIPQQTSFSDVINSIFTVQTMLTTANFPDVMIPYFKASTFAPVFFVGFMLLGFYLLIPLLLAVTYNKIKLQFGEQEEEFISKRSEALRAAFARLDVEVRVLLA